MRCGCIGRRCRQAEIQADMAAPLGGPPDTTVPSQVSGLAASAVSSSRVDLSWSAASDNVGVTGYEIERCQGAGCSSFAAVTTVTTLTWSDTGRSPGTSYSYRVRARDAAGNLGAYSSCGDGGDTDGGRQSAVGADESGGVGVGVDGGEPVVDGGDRRSRGRRRTRWSGVRVRAARGSCRWRRPSSTSLADTGLQASTSYSYRVRARDTGNQVGPVLERGVGDDRQPRRRPRSSNLVAAYAFDEGSGTSVADLSGNGNAGHGAGARRGRRREVREGACRSTGRARWFTVPDSRVAAI